MFVTKALARLTMFAGLMALPNAIPTAVYAQQAVTVGATDIGGTVVGASGPEAGVWVIAETSELPHQVRAHRRYRRFRPLSHSRSTDSQLQRLGARLWSGGFAQARRKAGPAAQPHRGASAERSGGGALLSGNLLVRDDEDSTGRRVRRQERHSCKADAD